MKIPGSNVIAVKLYRNISKFSFSPPPLILSYFS